MTPCRYCGTRFADERDLHVHHGEDCPGRAGLTPPERAELAALLRHAREDTGARRPSVLVEALHLALTGRRRDRKRRSELVLYRYEDALRDWLALDWADDGYITEELVSFGWEPPESDCSWCHGSGIGQHGDPDTSRCSACRGRGVAA